MINVHVLVNDTEVSAHAEKGANLLKVLQEVGLDIPAICGGKGICGKCGVKVLEGLLPPSKADLAFYSDEDIAAGWRLACTAYPETGIKISADEAGEKSFAAVTYYQPSKHTVNNIEVSQAEFDKSRESVAKRVKGNRKDSLLSGKLLQYCSRIVDEEMKNAYIYWDENKAVRISREKIKPYGIAVDIGTTTVGLALVELETGKVCSQLSAVNRQRNYGADVISRILNANSGQLHTISAVIREQLSGMFAQICEEYGISKGNIFKIAIAGNTTMIHLLCGLSCQSIGAYPFTTVTLDLIQYEYEALFDGNIDCIVEILPGISAYVGADITAGILFTGLYNQDKPRMLLDIGTNGEMALCKGGSIYCSSTAAGPAFEGGNILWGTGSVAGAISSVIYSNEEIAVTTIGDAPPVGICGSGVIDTVYQLYKNGIINKNGRFTKAYGRNSAVLAQTSQGEDIEFTQKDIRELQLGKSAIRSGIETLFTVAGLQYGDLDCLYIAGGFGYRINFDSGVGIGLIPEELRDKILPVGNSSLGGAIKFMLDSSWRQGVSHILASTVEHNLSEDKMFNQLFINNLNL